jgi:formamidopyrimidine-DNA glycosylase
MPELPEVETTARGLRQRIVGKRVIKVCGIDWPRMLPNTTAEVLRDALVGRTVEAVERRGKLLLLCCEGQVIVAVHRKMSGNLVLCDADAAPKAHTHLLLSFEHGTQLRFVDPRKFGRVYLFWSAAELEAFLNGRLGPEPLSELDEHVLGTLLRNRRGRIKPLLLDQAFLAGLGNLYADEALWEARIHPLRTADSLAPSEVSRLAAAVRQVLALAIERRGTSLSSYRDAEGDLGENQAYLNVYGRGPSRGRPARPCPRCGTLISRLVFGQRSSHFCPECQQLSR